MFSAFPGFRAAFPHRPRLEPASHHVGYEHIIRRWPSGKEPVDVTEKSRRASAATPVTQKQVAERAGVHVSTVSRILRRKEPASGWSASALRVLSAADELGYRPNQVAASLRTRQTRTIGLVMPRLTDVVIATTCQAIEATAQQSGYQLLLTTPEDDINAQLSDIDFLLSRQIDGLILTSMHLSQDSAADQLRSLPVPVLLTNRHCGDLLPSVVSDDTNGGRLATDHLLDLGHRRIGVVAGPRHASTAADRLTGYRQALTARDIPVDESLIVHTQFEVEGGVVGAHALLSLPDPPTAIFAVNDTAAVGVMGAARQRGLRVPEDLSLVGYNDIPIVAQLPTPLTTIRSAVQTMAGMAVKKLIDMIDGADDGVPDRQITPVELVIRSSTRRL
jgi:LacI family transcriptional regulator